MSEYRQLVAQFLRARNVEGSRFANISVLEAFDLAFKLLRYDDRPLYARVQSPGAGNRWKRRAGWKLVKRGHCPCYYQGYDCDCWSHLPQEWYEPDTVEQLVAVVRF